MRGMKMGGSTMSGAGYWSSVSGGAFSSSGTTRTYYLSADRVVWDYAPTGRNGITGQRFDEVADTYVKSGPGRIGSRYEKCIYRGYTDATFRHLKQRKPIDRYLGLLGPVIRAEVGDTIKVVFRNTCPFRASVHPHGVLYKKVERGRSVQRWHPRSRQVGRRCADRRQAHLHVAGSRTGGPGAE